MAAKERIPNETAKFKLGLALAQPPRGIRRFTLAVVGSCEIDLVDFFTG